jgi:hypothetical protein
MDLGHENAVSQDGRIFDRETGEMLNKIGRGLGFRAENPSGCGGAREIRGGRAGGSAGGGAAASGWRMVNAGGPGPVMAVAGQMRRTYHPGPLTLRVRLRPRRDNRGNFTPTGVGTSGSRKNTEKAAGPAK